MRRIVWVAIVMVSVACTAPETQLVTLAAGVKVQMADGTPLEVGGTGHAAPVYHDFDGDEVPDLIVGEYEDGAARIFRNHGTATEPVFRDFEFFEAGGKKATVPPD